MNAGSYLAAEVFQQSCYTSSTEKTIEDSLKELETIFSLSNTKMGAEQRDSKMYGSEDMLWEPKTSSSSDHSMISKSIKWDSVEQVMPNGISTVANCTSSASSMEKIFGKAEPSKPDSKQILVPQGSRVFVIKSNSDENVRISYDRGIWASTDYGNCRLSRAYRNLPKGAKLFLLFSVNGSGQFCGIAEMTSDVDRAKTHVWAEERSYKGLFSVSWRLVVDVPNRALRKFANPKNEMKPITQSRDTQEIPLDIARSVVEVFSAFTGSHQTS